TTTTTVSNNRSLTKTNKDKSNGGDAAADADVGYAEEEECDVEVWDTLSKNFKQVQTVLDHNRILIQQVNENHQSRTPDNLVKNVGLIREINRNISKVQFIYSDLSLNFSNTVNQRGRAK
ncbi:DUF1313 domain-containing protein, partial [Cephalotus follicularis]